MEEALRILRAFAVASQLQENALTIVAAAILAMTANAVLPVSPTLLEFVALPVKNAASFAAAPAVVEEVFPSPAAEPETQAVEDLFSSWETISQHRQLQQANDCDDPSGGSAFCCATRPGKAHKPPPSFAAERAQGSMSL